MIVNKPATHQSPVDFKIDGQNLNIVNEVSYLGIIIENTGNFKKCITSLYQKGIKALFKLKKSITPFPNVKTCLHLFSHMVKPILLYGSEIWAYSLFGVRNFKKVDMSNISTIYHGQRNALERAQINYGKNILGVKRHTDNLAIYGELGIYPLYIEAIERMLRYWYFIENKSDNELLKDAYSCAQVLNETSHSSWLQFANRIFPRDNSTKYSELNNKQIYTTAKSLKQNYAKAWQENIMSDLKTKSIHGRKLRTYRTFKGSHGMKFYLSFMTIQLENTLLNLDLEIINYK